MSDPLINDQGKENLPRRPGKATPVVKEEANDTPFKGDADQNMLRNLEFTPDKRAKSVIFGTAGNAGPRQNSSDFAGGNLCAKSAIGYGNMATTAGKGPNQNINKFKGMTQFREPGENSNNVFSDNHDNSAT